MFPIANIAPLIQVSVLIYAQVGIAKKNVRYCRRLAAEIKVMEPILKDIEAKLNDLPQLTKEMLDRALDMLFKDYEAALEFIERQNKISAIKKLVIARTTEDDFQEIKEHITSSRDMFVLALINKIDTATSSNNKSAPPPTAPSIPESLPTTTTPTPSIASSWPPVIPSHPPTPIPTPTSTLLAPIPVHSSIPPRIFAEAGHRTNSPDLTSYANSPDISYQSTTKIKMEDLRKAFGDKRYHDAIRIGKDLLKTVPPKSETCHVIYICIACSYAYLNEPEDAMTYLHSAKENGWDDVQYLECEDFTNLRNFPEFIIFKGVMIQERNVNERWRNLPTEQTDQLTRNFERYDIDGSGTISESEFRVLMKRTASKSVGDAQVTELFARMDAEKTGQILLNDYLNYMADHPHSVNDFLNKNPISMHDVTLGLMAFSLSPSITNLPKSTKAPPPSLGQGPTSPNISPLSPSHYPTPNPSVSYHDPTASLPHLDPPIPISPYSSTSSEHHAWSPPPTRHQHSLGDFNIHSLPPGHSSPDSFPRPRTQSLPPGAPADSFHPPHSTSPGLHSAIQSLPPGHSLNDSYPPLPTQSLPPGHSSTDSFHPPIQSLPPGHSSTDSFHPPVQSLHPGSDPYLQTYHSPPPQHHSPHHSPALPHHSQFSGAPMHHPPAYHHAGIPSYPPYPPHASFYPHTLYDPQAAHAFYNSPFNMAPAHNPSGGAYPPQHYPSHPYYPS